MFKQKIQGLQEKLSGRMSGIREVLDLIPSTSKTTKQTKEQTTENIPDLMNMLSQEINNR